MPASTDVARVTDRCAAAGLDLHATTSVGRYNAEVDPPFRLPGNDTSLVIVIGNTRAMWPHVDRFMRNATGPVSDPVDEYVESIVGQAVARLDGVIDVRYAHEPPPRRIAIQRLAHVAGLAWLSPSHLCIHPQVGPWMALRAAVVLDRPALSMVSPLEPLCDCSANCLPKLRAALAVGEPTNSAELIEHWRYWLAMRDACPVGRQYRYDDEQIVYHYIGERPERWSS